jgi:hypothetical protein
MINSLSDSGLQEYDSPRAETAETAKTPGSVPGHVRILLSQAASEALTATGESAFLVIGKASHPDDPSRWVIHCVPLDMKAACEACEVAQGIRKPGKRIITPAIEPEPVTATIESTTGARLDTIA